MRLLFRDVIIIHGQIPKNAVRFLNRTMLDGRIIRVDYDAGFVEGRQYGRGKHGGQVRDEYREQYDPDRGGYGKIWQDRERL
ncbi:hypothetical protein OSTOST_05889 [Ostertagia ostertagi]